MVIPKPEIEVERSDWMQRPGRTLVFHWGAFWFSANTADGGIVAFTIVTRWFMWGWHIEGSPVID